MSMKPQAGKPGSRLMSHFSAEHIGEGRIKYTCRTCGWKTIGGQIGPPVARMERVDGKLKRTKIRRYMNPVMAEKLAKYQNQGPGAHGHCPQCWKNHQKEQGK